MKKERGNEFLHKGKKIGGDSQRKLMTAGRILDVSGEKS